MAVPRNEYPRPHLRRSDDTWMCLNGVWDFEIDNDDKGTDRRFWEKKELSSKITVPFVPESKLSGVGNEDFMRRVWYMRTVDLPENFKSESGRILFHIGAADYECRVWINEKEAGCHRGGYTPMCFDITELVAEGENRITITCYDNTEDPLQPSGKQTARQEPYGCFYTRCTGIWQSVWLEYVPKSYIKSVKILPSVKDGNALISVSVCGSGDISVSAVFEGKTVSSLSAHTCNGSAEISLPIPDAHLWDVEQGNLYSAEITFGDDSVSALFGMREIKTEGNKVLLNGKPLFQRLVLDQGYFPDGIYTPADAKEFRRDIELAMAAGFNGARMHMKIFDPIYIYEADKAGFLLWGEYPNWGLDIARTEADDVMLPEWQESLERDVNHPSIIGWCPFNEAFPMSNTAIVDKAVKAARDYDPTRLIIESSGWTHTAPADIYDVHDYIQDPVAFAEKYKDLTKKAPFPDGEGGIPGQKGYDGRLPFFMSEFGGAFYDLDACHENSTQESGNPWGYGEAPKNEDEFIARLDGLCKAMRENEEICGFCYTQFTDVMQEMNGIFTYDRREKFPMDRVRKAVKDN